MSNGALPSYLSMAKPNPPTNRAAWYKNTAPTYAGIFLWFVFWSQAPSGGSGLPGGVLSQGIGAALLGLVIAALLCHYLFYLVPGLFGLKTGLPLYVVGTSTYGTQGGFLMPGFLMGVLQFGWLGVNTYFSSLAILSIDPGSLAGKNVPFLAIIVMIVYGALAAFLGLKGIQYVARVATYLPLIPIAVLVVMFFATVGGLNTFEPKVLAATQIGFNTAPPAPAFSGFALFAFIVTYVVGFFATAGAAGVDFGTNSRDERDVHMGGFVGIALATMFTAGLAMLIVAGAYGKANVVAQAQQLATDAATNAQAAAVKAGQTDALLTKALPMTAYELIPAVLGAGTGKIIWILLAIAAFPAACFSSFIAANSFKTTLSKVNPFISVGIGAIVSILLAVTKLAGRVSGVFGLIGASFGPICGAMAVDYMLNGCKWAGPRKGFNPAGWLAWAFGFAVGIMPNLGLDLPLAPVWAMVVGAVVYYLAAKAGLQAPQETEAAA